MPRTCVSGLSRICARRGTAYSRAHSEARLDGGSHPITMGTITLTQELHSQVEKLILQFIVTEVDTAWIFAHTAETMHVRGSTENADRLVSKAREAYAGAASHLKQSPINRDLREKLAEKLTEIRIMLDALPRRNGRIHGGKNGKR
jgi:hypothetical protein